MSISTKVTGVGYHIPEQKISNAYVLNRLMAASRPHLGRVDLDSLSGEAERKMDLAGCRTRYWCREDEYCTDIALAASRMAIADAGIHPRDIDYLIFTGMSKAVVLQATSDALYTEAPYHFHLAYSMVGNTFSYCHIGLNHGIGERYKLKSHSRKLFDTASLAAWNLIMEKRKTDPGWGDQPIDRLLFHDVGNHLSRKALPFFAPLFAHMPLDYFSYFREYGNVASSSFPLCRPSPGTAPRRRADHGPGPAGGGGGGLLAAVVPWGPG